MAQSIGQKFTPLSLLKFTLPSMVMMVFMSLYMVVDGVFISRLVDSSALSAANIVYPAASVLIAVGVMLAAGGSAVVAKEMGEGKEEAARGDFTFLVVTGLVISVLFTVFTAFFCTQISYALGASDALIQDCNAYLKTIMYFAPASMLQMIFQSFFVAAGKPNLGLLVTVLAGVANAVLDYALMGVIGMGIEGAAIATGLGQLIPAVVGILYFGFGKGTLRLVRFRADFLKLGQACFNGASEMVTNISNAVVTFLFNVIMMRLAGEHGVAAITIILYGQFLFNSLYMGFSMGTAPIISYHFGAQNEKELKNVTGICHKFVVLSSVVVTALSFFLADAVAAVFVTKGSPVYEMAAHGFLVFSISYLFSGYNIFTSSYFTALSDGKTSAVISFARTFVCIVASLLLLPEALGVTGVWLAIPVAELASVGLCMFCKRKKAPTAL